MMHGTVRLGAIGMAIGLMFTAMAPTNASAMRAIAVDKSSSFPDSVNGDHLLSGKDEKKRVDDGKKLDHSKFFPFGQLVRKKAPLGPPDPIPFGQKVSNLVPTGPPNPFGKKHDRDKRDHGDHVASAPEPATWIMMIAGFWIVAWRLRRFSAEGPRPATA